MENEKAVGQFYDGTRYVDYEVLYRNYSNVEWSEWPKIYDVIRNIEKAGSVSWKYPQNPLIHLMMFLNNYLLERKVKEKMQLEWYNDDHDVLVEKKGEDVPDFIDESGKTYELKQGNSFERAMNVKTWRNADVKLFYNTDDNTLYYYHGNMDCFEKISEFRSAFVNIKRYRDTESKIRYKFNLYY